MLMPEIISKFRFLEFGKSAPKGSRFKGILTTESIIGFFNYTSDKKKAEESLKKGYVEMGLLGYTSRGTDLRTYTQNGWLTNKGMRDFKETIRDAFHKKGNLIWDTVVSLEGYEVSEDKNLNTVDDYVAVVNKVLPSFFRYAGFDPSNMGYWMNYHSDKLHPHIHLVFFERHQTVTKGELPQSCVNKFKSLFIKEMALRSEFQKKYGNESKEFFKLIDQDRRKLLICVKERDLSQISELQQLYAKLPKSGRLSYNSQNIAKYKSDIDKVIDKILESDDIAELYSQWLGKVQQLDSMQNEYANDKISTLKNTEIKKMYSLIGNTILRAFKDYRSELSTREVTVPISRLKISEGNISLEVGDQTMLLNEDLIEYHGDNAEIDLTQDEYVFFNPETGDQMILDREEVIETLKDQMKEDQHNGVQQDKRMAFSGFHSRQVRNTFPCSGLNRQIYAAIAQQVKEKEHDLDVFLHGDKDKKRER